MICPHRFGRVVVMAVLLSVAGTAAADGLRLGANAGVSRSYDQTYVHLGGRLGYDIGFGITPELGASYWFGGTPTWFHLEPGVTWYLPLPLVRPYVGGFYAHDFFSSGLPGRDAIGGRAGLAMFGVGPLSVNVGLAYQRTLSCSLNCDTWWPEASAGIGF